MKHWLGLAALLVCLPNASSAQPANSTPAAGVYFASPPVLADQQYGLLTLDNTGALRISGSFTSGNTPVQGAVTTTAPTYSTGTNQLLSLTTAGALRTDGSGVTQPVSGTFWQATQPISAAALPLPSGASTSAAQTTGNTSLASIDTKMPAAPATAGNQTTANTSLASIDTKTPASPATAGNQTTANTSLASIDTKSGVPRTPATGTGTPAAVTVGVSSAQALAAATRTQRLVLQNVSASASVACSLGGTAALNTAGSFQISPGQILNLGDGLYIPGDAVNCIASASSTPLTAWSR